VNASQGTVTCDCEHDLLVGTEIDTASTVSIENTLGTTSRKMRSLGVTDAVSISKTISFYKEVVLVTTELEGASLLEEIATACCSFGSSVLERRNRSTQCSSTEVHVLCKLWFRA
jgi:hypothetical protein